MSAVIDNETRDEILTVLTRARQIVDVLAKVGEAAFPGEALLIEGLDLGLGKAFELAVRLTADTESLDTIKARLRDDTLEQIRNVPAVP